jgi:hypothetical protein
MQAYPNPASNTISLDLTTEKEMPLCVELIDMTGRCVQRLFNGTIKKGQWNMSRELTCSSGIYVVRATSAGAVLGTQSMRVAR